MEKNNMRDFSKEDLYLIRDFIETFNDVKTVKSEVDIMIYDKEKEEKERQEKSLNHRLTIEEMEKLHLFDSELLNLLKRHNIKNMQDLIDANLDKWDLGRENLSGRRPELEDAKVWYDFSRLEKNIGKMKKKRK